MASRNKNKLEDQTQEECSEEQLGAPCRGDTLPWNLSKHQRIKRSKSSSGEVLDPAERAVIRIAGTSVVSGLRRGVFHAFKYEYIYPAEC